MKYLPLFLLLSACAHDEYCFTDKNEFGSYDYRGQCVSIFDAYIFPKQDDESESEYMQRVIDQTTPHCLENAAEKRHVLLNNGLIKWGVVEVVNQGRHAVLETDIGCMDNGYLGSVFNCSELEYYR